VEARHVGSDRRTPRLVGARLDVAFVLFHFLLDLGDLPEGPLALLAQYGRLVPELLDLRVEPGRPLVHPTRRPVVFGREFAQLRDVGVALAQPA
jgi:hypothetical protein